ncbi:HU family DNA-binding protein [Ruegeria sp. PrR005]|uniref:HU family DNA-binding protein n=1 Tax=Ruegeria sp. PrR005 TaxID=2706882 RepID=UPI001EF329BC|nr:HU family DNA-binding protein [Ruegeria sp. PrR005]
MAKRTTRTPSTTRKTTARSPRKAPVASKETDTQDPAEQLARPLPEVIRGLAESDVQEAEPVDADAEDVDVGDDGNELRKRELIDLVVARSEVKKKFAKPAVEAMLAILGEAISDGRSLNLSPMGKLKVNRSTDKGTGQVIICKLRRSTQDSAPVEKLDQDPLAEPAE